MPHRLKDPDILALHASDDSLNSHHSHPVLHASAHATHIMTKPNEVSIQPHEASHIAAHAPVAPDVCVPCDASTISTPPAVAKRLEDVHAPKSPLRSDSSSANGTTSAANSSEHETHIDGDEHDGVDVVDEDDDDVDDDDFEQSGDKLAGHSTSSKDSTPHTNGSTSADSTPQMVFRRHRRRPRRSTAELEMYERWTCPKNCGKVYRKNSTVSIRKHLPHCTGPPVYMPPQVHSFAMMQPHVPHHPYDMSHYDPNMPPAYHMEYAQQACLPYAPSLPPHMHHRTMHQQPPQHHPHSHPAHPSMYSMDPSQVSQSYGAPYSQTHYPNQSPYPNMQPQQQYATHPMMQTQQMSMSMQPPASQLPGSYPNNASCYAPPPQQMTPPQPNSSLQTSRLPMPTLPPMLPLSSQLPTPTTPQQSSSPIAANSQLVAGGGSSPLTAATALAALMRVPEPKAAPPPALNTSAFSRVIPRQA